MLLVLKLVGWLLLWPLRMIGWALLLPLIMVKAVVGALLGLAILPGVLVFLLTGLTLAIVVSLLPVLLLGLVTWAFFALLARPAEA